MYHEIEQKLEIIAERLAKLQRQVEQQSAAADDEMLDPAEAAEFLGVSTVTLSRWRSNGTGPDYYKNGSTIRYNKRNLVR